MSSHNPTGMGSFEAPPQGSGPTWGKLFEAWDEIKWDIAETYRVDLDLDLDRARVCWHWVVSRLSALLSAPPAAYRPDGYPMPVNRLQRALFPLPAPRKD